VRRTLERGKVPEPGLERVLLRSEHRHLPARHVLYAQDTPAEFVFALRKGSLKLTRRGPDGEPRIVRCLGAGAVAGLEALLEPRYRTGAVALEPIEFCRVPIAVLRHLEGAGPAFYRELMCHWQAHLDAADSFMSAPGSGTTEQQLARLLLALEEGKCPSLPRGDIGAALGVTMETASRLMASFRRRGLIRGTGRHLQCNAAPLRQLIAGATKG
jgi:CRP/FNR family transcriptional regulator, anaerobic regulatory protein